MARFVTIGYGDEDGYNRTDPAVRDAAHAQDERLRQAGATLGVAGRPVMVRNHAGSGIRTERGQFLSCELPLAGFGLIEADSLDEAIDMASRTPCAVAYGVVEVWPLDERP